MAHGFTILNYGNLLPIYRKVTVAVSSVLKTPLGPRNAPFLKSVDDAVNKGTEFGTARTVGSTIVSQIFSKARTVATVDVVSN